MNEEQIEFLRAQLSEDPSSAASEFKRNLLDCAMSALFDYQYWTGLPDDRWVNTAARAEEVCKHEARYSAWSYVVSEMLKLYSNGPAPERPVGSEETNG
jgi:hypothetical protein